MFGFGNSKAPFDINDLTGGYGMSHTELIQYRISKGYKTTTPTTDIVSARKKYNNIGEVLITNTFYPTGCTIGVQYKSEYDALVSAIEMYCTRKEYSFDSMGYYGWKLPCGDYLRGGFMGGMGYELKVYPKEQVKER